MKNVFVSNHPLLRHKLTLLRDTETKHKQFREVVGEMAKLLCYEATQDLPLQEQLVTTPLGTAKGYRLLGEIGLVPILRAGLGMVDGMLEMLPGSQVWHLGFYRDEKTLHPVAYYNKLPNQATVQMCLILDPMLATGGSAVAAVDTLKHWGAERIKFVGLIGSPEGIEKLHSVHPDVPIHLAAIDDGLNDIGFIVPGLGDAGDRQFGTG
ncbi:MAG: uracil phosphoribosyltransferase [Phototrophicales bacterium]|nr:MAG: uracil phosphoribosyltransferase [Phototrophicales bacterium]